MNTQHTNESLRQFEDDVIQMYKDGKLRSPIHLSRGNEAQLLEVFKDIKPNDWVFSTYRSHYHCLLKGVPADWLKDWILDNKSIHVMNKEHKIITSAIVGGTLPIALGVAMGIKQKSVQVSIPHYSEETLKSSQKGDGSLDLKISPHVWCFVGDMTMRTGGFHECLKYADNFDLPITFVVEDNLLSTDTKTEEAWNDDNLKYFWYLRDGLKHINVLTGYRYKRELPHYGCGVFVDFKDEGLKQDGAKF